MRYPAIIIHQHLLVANLEQLLISTTQHHLQLVGVVKLLAGDKPSVRQLVKHGLTMIGDSRIENLIKYNTLPCTKMLLRIPMPSETELVVQYVDCCLVSELATIKQLCQAACKQNRSLQLILMIESGDIREGVINYEDACRAVEFIITHNGVELVGLGTNFACYGATKPTVDKLNIIAEFKRHLEQRYQITIPIISAGNSSHLAIWDEPGIDSAINQIRSGAALLMGFGWNDVPIPKLSNEVFELRAEIVEVQWKPSVGIGEKGLDAFGQPFMLPDIGLRKKAIIAIGGQDCPASELQPYDAKIHVLGGSSDHTILDITDSDFDHQVGDIIHFHLSYSGVLRSMTSKYVHKYHLK